MADLIGYLTLEQYHTKAMLLGMVYDARDHTLNAYDSDGSLNKTCDPDTMEDTGEFSIEYRSRLIRESNLGPRWLIEISEQKRDSLWLEAIARENALRGWTP